MNRILVYIFLIMLSIASLSAQDVNLSGQVFGNNGTVVSGALVKLQDSQLQDLTDDEGKFLLNGPLTGTVKSSSHRNRLFFQPSEGVISFTAEQKTSIRMLVMNIRGEILFQSGELPLEEGHHNFSLGMFGVETGGYFVIKIITGEKEYHLRMLYSGGEWTPAGAVSSRSDIAPLAKRAGPSENLTISAEGYITREWPLNWTRGRDAEVIYDDEFEIIILTPENGTDIYADYRQSCVDRMNSFRATIGMDPLARWTEAEMCIDAEARLDSETGTAHGAYGNCEEWGQNECPGWGSVDNIITGCLQSMWDEGPGPDGCADDPACYQEHGHYINMTNTSYTKAACGFYEGSNGKIWGIQNLR